MAWIPRCSPRRSGCIRKAQWTRRAFGSIWVPFLLYDERHWAKTRFPLRPYSLLSAPGGLPRTIERSILSIPSPSPALAHRFVLRQSATSALQSTKAENNRKAVQRQTGIRCLPKISGSKAFVFPYFSNRHLTSPLPTTIFPTSSISGLTANSFIQMTDTILAMITLKIAATRWLLPPCTSRPGSAPHLAISTRSVIRNTKSTRLLLGASGIQIPLLHSFHPTFPRSLTRH